MTPKRPMKPYKGTVVKPLDFTDVRMPCMVQRKIDGVRMVVFNGKAYSSSLKLLPNKHLQDLAAVLPDGIDGEVAAPTFSRAVSFAMSQNQEPSDVFYFVFDWILDKSAAERIKKLEAFVTHGVVTPIPLPIVVVTTKMAYDHQQLQHQFTYVTDRGGEGIVTRCPNFSYIHGRSTLRDQALLAFKLHHDADATVIGYVQYTANHNDPVRNELGLLSRSSSKSGKVPVPLLGALTVRNSDGVTFNIGSGFTLPEREALWLNRDTLKGRKVVYRARPVPYGQKPHPAIFKGFREP